MSVLVPKRVINRPEYYEQYDDKSDEFGYNSNTVKHWQTFFQFLYEGYFQVQAIGIENIPNSGRAVLIGNHSGVIPLDAFMTCTAVFLHHKSPRRIRYLTHNFLRSNKVVKDLICGFGGVPATYVAATKLLENEELVFFYPEGAKGTGKPFSMRYRLYDFDPGFVKAAIETGSPIIPVITIGGDEIYPLLGNLNFIAHLTNTPYWPVTTTFPWLPFIASCIPLPIKFLIKFGEPIYLNHPKERISDRALRLRLTKEIQYGIQREMNALLRIRKSPFSGW